jgi:hypothetical protein
MVQVVETVAFEQSNFLWRARPYFPEAATWLLQGDCSMYRRKALTVYASLATAALVPLAKGASAQKIAPQAFVGSWRLVLVDNVLPNGERVQLYGPNPQGLAMFDASGHYSLQILRDGRPKFAANDKGKGTPEEYKAAVQGSNCHYGRYVVDESTHTLTLFIEHATFSNWEGTELAWPFTFKGDEVSLIIPHPTTGGPNVTGEVVLKRLA